MTSKTLAVLLLSIWLAACNRAPENKDAIRQGILDHLSKNTGLDLKSMDVDVNNVNFQGEKATATVSFKPKNSPDAGMSMNYTLAREGKKWTVQRTAGTGGHGAMSAPEPASPAGELPSGHPPVSGEVPGAAELPSGHPPVNPPPVKPKK